MFSEVGFLVVGCFVASVSGSGADVVLSCFLVEEGAGMGGFGGMVGGALFTRTAATLVLRDLAVSPDQSPETLTPYIPPTTPDPDDIIFESFVTSLEIPEADMLLHADCNEQEVTCEISQYLPRGTAEDAHVTYFIGSVQLEGGGISLSLVLRTVPLSGEESSVPPLVQKKLTLPLSQSGTLLTEVAFLVFSRTQAVMAPIGGEAYLDCGFRLQGMTQLRHVGLEWRLQHRGNGRRILEIKANEEEEEEGAAVIVERDGSHVDPAQVLGKGNASLSLVKLKVSDEGTYICSVSTGMFQAQQVIQLHVVQLPRVHLSVTEVLFQDESPRRVSCHCERYYPLDVQVEWLSLPPTASEPILISKDVSLSSHRQYSDGTFSLSSHVTLYPSDYLPGTTVTCQVSHSSMTTPVSISLTVLAPDTGQSYWIILGLLASTVLFVYRLLA